MIFTIRFFYLHIYRSFADPDDIGLDPDPTFEKSRIRVLFYINFVPKLLKIANKTGTYL
jgi:hypothetical protein